MPRVRVKECLAAVGHDPPQETMLGQPVERVVDGGESNPDAGGLRLGVKLFRCHPVSHVAQKAKHQVDALPGRPRSEEHTSELQSLMRISYAVFCLKKKK